MDLTKTEFKQLGMYVIGELHRAKKYPMDSLCGPSFSDGPSFHPGLQL